MDYIDSYVFSIVVLGYTVTSVVSARSGQLYVAGAPRFNHTGKVIIFTLKNTGELTILYSLKGHQVGVWLTHISEMVFYCLNTHTLSHRHWISSSSNLHTVCLNFYILLLYGVSWLLNIWRSGAIFAADVAYIYIHNSFVSCHYHRCSWKSYKRTFETHFTKTVVTMELSQLNLWLCNSVMYTAGFYNPVSQEKFVFRVMSCHYGHRYVTDIPEVHWVTNIAAN